MIVQFFLNFKGLETIYATALGNDLHIENIL